GRARRWVPPARSGASRAARCRNRARARRSRADHPRGRRAGPGLPARALWPRRPRPPRYRCRPWATRNKRARCLPGRSTCAQRTRSEIGEGREDVGGRDTRRRRTLWLPSRRVKSRAPRNLLRYAGVEAAFFDLDKTVIATSSVMALGGRFYREGLISKRTIVRGIYGQVVYLLLGADDEKMERMREAMLALTKGWDQQRVSDIVRETLDEV